MTNKTNTKMNATAQKVVDFLTANKGKEFTFAEICEACHLNTKSTGSITRLLASDKNPDGLIKHGAEVVKPVVVNKPFKTYKID